MDSSTLALFREHLGDVSLEEHDQYLEVEAKATASIIDRCDLKLAELGTEYNTYINVARTHYTYTVPLLVMGTYKKLRPTASEKEKEAMYFAAWLSDWIGCTILTICDICDGKNKRAGQPTLPVQLGSSNAMCLYLTIMSTTYDLVAETFAQEPYVPELLKICRNHVKIIALSQLIDTSCGKYDRRRDMNWYQVREYSSSTAPCFVLPLELAFCVTQESMDSEFGKASLKLANLMGAFFRNIDDVLDLESDTLAGRLNWAFWPAWEKANEDQRNIMLEGTRKDFEKESAEKLVKLYGDMNIKKDFEDYASLTLQSQKKLFDESPEEIPKLTWKAIPEFVPRLYSGAAGSVNFHDHCEITNLTCKLQ